MLHSAADLDRMRNDIRTHAQPVYAGFVVLRDDPHSSLGYVSAGASEEVGRNPNVRTKEFDSDANAAYQCALMGHITGNAEYFRITASILDAWAAKLRRISGADAILCAGLGGFKLANAAELLRWSHAQWPQERAEAFGNMLRDVFVPVLRTFAPFANGNWDTAAMKTLMAIAIYRDDRELFDRVLVYYAHGCGDGRLENYIYANGQCQESGRDQQHTQLGIAHLGDCCEMAWHQGLDLYGLAQNRLLLGFEYTARYILGEDVRFVPDVDKTGQYRHAVISPRSPLRPVYEQIYNHYVKRRGLDAPWVAKAAATVRPEGPGFQADHTGFGTLLYSRPAGADGSASADAQPAGLYADSDATGIVELDWVPPIGGGPSRIVRMDGHGATVNAGVASFADHAAKSGRKYAYRVADGRAGSRLSRTDAPVSIVAALPAGWSVGDAHTGRASTDGEQWRLTAQGKPFFSVETQAPAEHSVVARLSRQFASQWLRAGLVLRAGGMVARVLVEPAGDDKRGWAIRLYVEASPNAPPAVLGERILETPFVSYNRVDIPVWFRIGSEQHRLAAAYSPDGTHWIKLDSSVALADSPVRGGLIVSSGIEDVSTQVIMDRVAFSPSLAG